jgi:hypothetical protein
MRSLELEYAEALRAGGAEGRGARRGTSRGRSDRGLFGARGLGGFGGGLRSWVRTARCQRLGRCEVASALLGRAVPRLFGAWVLGPGRVAEAGSRAAVSRVLGSSARGIEGLAPRALLSWVKKLKFISLRKEGFRPGLEKNGTVRGRL